MDTLIVEKFCQEYSEKLHKVIDEILSLGKEESLGAIGFITTDDFYGFYYSVASKSTIGKILISLHTLSISVIEAI